METETPHGIRQQSVPRPLFWWASSRPIDPLIHFATEKPAWKLAALIVKCLPAILFSMGWLLYAIARGG